MSSILHWGVRQLRFRLETTTVDLAVGAILVVILPFVVSTSLAGQMLLMGIFGISYNLLLGYSGELSFGHAAFFGAGAYGVTIYIAEFSMGVYPAIAATLITSIGIGLLFGAISLRRRGIYFAMITLALAQMVYFLTLRQRDITGGRDGMVFPPTEVMLGPVNILGGDIGFYLFAAGTFAVVFFFSARIVSSPFGKALAAIRENEERARHIGYSPTRMLLLSFVLSGLLASVAGILYAFHFAFIGPNILFWSMTGTVVLLTVMGGTDSLIGPVVGAIIYLFIQNRATAVTEHVEIVFGTILVLIVIFAPSGVYGQLSKLGSRLSSWLQDSGSGPIR
jgi:branched-chain amino acid transport system permease protein